MDQDRTRRRTALAHAPVAAWFALLALAWTWPLVLSLGTSVPGAGAGDNLSFVWNLWWTRFALSHHLDPLYTTWLFYPVGVSLIQHTHTLLSGVVGATALALLPPVAAQNVLILLSLFLNGFACYLLAFRLASDRFAAVAAGIAFAGAPVVLVRLYGHFNLVAAWTIPLAILLFDRAIETRTRRASIAAGLALAAVAWNDGYFFVYTVVFLGLSLVVRWFGIDTHIVKRSANRVSLALAALLVIDAGLMAAVVWSGGFTVTAGRLSLSMTTTFNERIAFWVLLIAWILSRWRVVLEWERRDESPPARDVRALVIGGLAFAVAASPLIVSAVRLWVSGDYTSQPYRWRSGPAGIDLASLLLGNPLHPLTGHVTRRAYTALSLDPVEGIGWPGAILLAVLLLGWPLVGGRAEARRWWAAAGVFGVWALGPFLSVLGWNTGLVLPAMLLRAVPVLANVRIPGRAMVMVVMAGAMLLAQALAGRAGAWGAGRKAIVLVILLLDCATVPLPLYRVVPGRIDAYLASQPVPGAVLEVPLGLRDGFGESGRFDSRVLYDQTVSEQPMLGGFVARLPARVKAWYQQAPVVSSVLALSDPACPQPWAPPPIAPVDAFEVLRGLGVRYVIVDRALSPSRLLEYVTRSLPLQPVMTDGDRELYEIRDPR